MNAIRGDILRSRGLASHTAWRVGGLAYRLFKPADIDDLACFLKQLPPKEPLTWLGLGSNVLVRDQGVRGTVILTFPSLGHINLLEDGALQLEAGVACTQAARFSARHSLQGIEFLAGIPGSIGGALMMNAGCYGGETWDAVHHVETIDRRGERRIRQASEFDVAYRSVKGQAEEWFVSATFQLTPGEKAKSLQLIRELLASRNAAQPTNLPNCGSVFRNPPNDYAARLIEASGLKSYRIGGASVSNKHANFIVNDDKATASDIEQLIEYVEKTVWEKQGVQLMREVKIIGRR